MEEFLPLLLGVIWLAFTLYNKGKKKKLAARFPEKSSERKRQAPSIIEQFLSGNFQQQEEIYSDPEEDFEELSQMNSPDELIFYPSTETKKERVPFLSTELSRFTDEGQPAGFEKEEEKDNYLIKNIYDESEQDFDLKKAVIYATILDAPYIDSK